MKKQTKLFASWGVSLTLALTLVPSPALAEAADALTSVASEQAAATQVVDDQSASVDAPSAEKPADAATTASTSDSAAEAGTAPASDEAAPAQATPAESGTAATPQADAASQVKVAFEVVGPDAMGADSTWVAKTELTVDDGTTAADLTEKALANAGLAFDASVGSYGWSLNSITSADGRVVSMPADYSAYWQLFVNGKSSDLGAGSVTLKSGDVVTWYYSGYGSSLPKGDVTVDPGATRPDYNTQWNGFANGGSGSVTDANTPTTDSKLDWNSDLKGEGQDFAMVSDPVLANGDVYIATGSELRILDAKTGAVKKSAQLATSIGYTCRMVYADGLIVVPLNGGRLQALTADTLTTVWVTDALPADQKYGDQQSLTPLTVKDGYVYFGTAVADWTSTYGGYYVCVSLATGTVRWSSTNATSGYYWDGAASVGDYLVYSDDAGTVYAVNAATGATAGTLALGTSVRSSVVALDGSSVLVVSKDGVLHKLQVSASGAISESGKVSFAASSTSTPTVVGGRAYVGGATADYKGLLAVVDLASMTVANSVTTLADGSALPGSVQATPTVSAQAGGTYVYFTCNAEPGGIYVYRLGDASAALLFEPKGDLSNYSITSISVGADGALYYTNDSGNLFKVVAAGSATENGGNTNPTEPTNPSETPSSKPGSTTKPAATKKGGSQKVPATGDVTSSALPAFLLAAGAAVVAAARRLKGSRDEQ